MCLKHLDMYIPCISIKVDVDNRESNGTPLQYSCLENPMDGGAWWATVHGVAKSWNWTLYLNYTQKLTKTDLDLNVKTL